MDSVTTLQCQNLTCLAPNPLTNKFCEKCGTPLVKRYLWMMMGDGVKTFYRIGDLVDNRYLVKQPQIVLDTKPAQAPQAPEEPPSWIALYLKFLPFHLHIPQVYGYIPSPDERLNMDVWLLEYGTIPLDETGELIYPQLLPTLAEAWPQAPALRQIHWLWQIAKLWSPLQKKAVVSSLLDASLTRVNSHLVQLLELSVDQAPAPSLKDLGALWSGLVAAAAPNLQDFLTSVAQELQNGEIDRPESLIAILDHALQHYGQTQQYTYQVFTCTDTGPMREHNEDACYPPPNQSLTLDKGDYPLVIVCDGIGGQEGGEIASQLAIETLVREVHQSPISQAEVYPDSYHLPLEQAIRSTNDLISQRNDQEFRQDRQRMGTTLVMTFARDHEVYAAHVGDSRIYWITPQSCHQVTVDDDLASREVKLGYLLYRDAVQYPNAGALVQALGMSSATNLHPTVQRLIVDQDCVLLLCSDGLSDYDRVEQYWDSEIVPLFTGEKTVAEVGESLLQLANQKNGHDNVTIALVYCQVVADAQSVTPLVYSDVQERIIPTINTDDFDDSTDTYHEEEVVTAIPTPTPASVTVTNSSAESARANIFPLIIGVLCLGVLGIIGVIGWKSLIGGNPPVIQTSPSPVISPTPLSPSNSIPSSTTPSPSPTPLSPSSPTSQP